MPQTVYLLRHAETTDPTVFHGCESDVDLSDQGRLQAELIADYLATLPLDRVVSSAMLRAARTATSISNRCRVPHLVEPRLHERCVGVLSRMPFDHDGIWHETQQRWLAGETAHTTTGAESWDDLRQRLLPVWEMLTAGGQPRAQAIVTHGICCKLFLLELLPGWSVKDWYTLGPIFNVGIHELVREGTGWRAARLNFLPETLPAPKWGKPRQPGKDPTSSKLH